MKKILQFLRRVCIKVFKGSKALIIYLIKKYIDELVKALKKNIDEEMTEKEINEIIDDLVNRAVAEISVKYPFAEKIAKIVLQGFADYLKVQLKQKGELTVAEVIDIVAEIIKSKIADKIENM